MLLVAAHLRLCSCNEAPAAPAGDGSTLEEDVGTQRGSSPAWSESAKFTAPLYYPLWNNAATPTKQPPMVEDNRLPSSAPAAAPAARPPAAKPHKQHATKRIVAGVTGLAVFLALFLKASPSRAALGAVSSSQQAGQDQVKASRSHRSQVALARLATVVKAAQEVQPRVLNNLAAMHVRLRSTFTTAKGIEGCNDLSRITEAAANAREAILQAPISFLTADALDNETEVAQLAATSLKEMLQHYGSLGAVAARLTEAASRRADSNAAELGGAWDRVHAQIAALARQVGHLNEEEAVLDVYMKALNDLALRLQQDVEAVQTIADRFIQRAGETETNAEGLEGLVELLTLSSQDLQLSEARLARGTATVELVDEWLQRADVFLRQHLNYMAKYRLLNAWPSLTLMELQRLQLETSTWDAVPEGKDFDEHAKRAHALVEQALRTLREIPATTEEQSTRIASLLDNAADEMAAASQYYLKLAASQSTGEEEEDDAAVELADEQREALEAKQLDIVYGMATSIVTEAVEFADEAVRTTLMAPGLTAVEMRMNISRRHDLRRAKAVDAAVNREADARAAAVWVSNSQDVQTAMDNLLEVVAATLSALEARREAERNLALSSAGSLMASTAERMRASFYRATGFSGSDSVPLRDCGGQYVERLYRALYDELSIKSAADLYNELAKKSSEAEDVALNESLSLQGRLARRLVDEATTATAFGNAKFHLAMEACGTKVLAQATFEQIQDMADRILELEAPQATTEGAAAAPRIRAAVRHALKVFGDLMGSFNNMAKAGTLEDLRLAGRSMLTAKCSLMKLASSSRVILYTALVSAQEAKLPDPRSGPQDIPDGQQPARSEEGAIACARAASLEEDVAERKARAMTMLESVADDSAVESLTSQLNAEALVIRRVAEHIRATTEAQPVKGGTTATQLLISAYECLTYMEELKDQFQERVLDIQNILDIESALKRLDTLFQ